MTTQTTDHRNNIYTLRDDLEREISAALEDNFTDSNGFQNFGEWWDGRILSTETWASEDNAAKRVDIMLGVGGPTTWIDYDGRYGISGHATLHHSWGRNAEGEDCKTAEMSGELIETLLERIGAI